MVPVASASSPFEARLLTAHLGAEGVLWELRGSVDGVYPVGVVEVLVPITEADRAREVLAAAPLDDGWEPEETWGEPA